MMTLTKWSTDDYHRMIEAEILGDRRVELLTGEIVEIAPATPLHDSTAKRGAKYLEQLLEGKADVRLATRGANGAIEFTLNHDTAPL